MKQHLIFEGAELAGKSWLMSQVYNHFIAKYQQNKNILNACHWFNCDNGVLGSSRSKAIINHYVDIFSELNNKNIIVEKLHLADKIYHRLYTNTEPDYSSIEKKLLNLNFKIILITFPEDKQIIQKRIADRLRLYPHYKKILKTPQWYIIQQQEYLKEIKKTKLASRIIATDNLPDNKLLTKILAWI